MCGILRASSRLDKPIAHYVILLGQAESGLQVLSPTALRDVEWATWTCPFGFPVMGKTYKRPYEDDQIMVVSFRSVFSKNF